MSLEKTNTSSTEMAPIVLRGENSTTLAQNQLHYSSNETNQVQLTMNNTGQSFNSACLNTFGNLTQVNSSGSQNFNNLKESPLRHKEPSSRLESGVETPQETCDLGQQNSIEQSLLLQSIKRQGDIIRGQLAINSAGANKNYIHIDNNGNFSTRKQLFSDQKSTKFMKNQVTGPNININLGSARFDSKNSGMMDMGSILIPANNSTVQSKISNQEARVMIIRNLERLELEVKKMNPKGRRLDCDEKEFLEKILSELALLREQIAFLDPADGHENH